MGRLPVFTSLRGYQRTFVSRDLVAGLTVWAVLVPESLAYATIAGVSPVVGLYAESVPVIDVTASRMLVQLSDQLDREGVALWMARDIGQVRDLLAASGGGALLDRVRATVDEAVTAAGPAGPTA